MRFGKGLLAVFALIVLAPGMAASRDRGHHAGREGISDQGSRQPPRTMAGISMDQAIEIAQRRYKARVVRADVSEAKGRRVYVLRLLSDQGRVWTVRIDAETGSEI